MSSPMWTIFMSQPGNLPGVAWPRSFYTVAKAAEYIRTSSTCDGPEAAASFLAWATDAAPGDCDGNHEAFFCLCLNREGTPGIDEVEDYEYAELNPPAPRPSVLDWPTASQLVNHAEHVEQGSEPWGVILEEVWPHVPESRRRKILGEWTEPGSWCADFAAEEIGQAFAAEEIGQAFELLAVLGGSA